MRKKGMTFIFAASMLALLSACADNPDTSVVKEKNLDRMIEKAENTEEDAVYYEDIVRETGESYQSEIKDDSLGVSVKVDARVEIPETTQLSVFRVRQKKIENEFIDKVKAELAPDVTYYDGNILSKETKETLAEKIQNRKKMIDDLAVGQNGISNEEALEDYKEEYQQSLTEWEAEYEKAPDSVNLTDFPSDNKIHTAKELYDSNPEDYFYEWEYSLNPNGEVYYGVSDAKDGNFVSLFMQNNENYGNCLRFESSKNGYMFVNSAWVNDMLEGEWVEKGENPAFENLLVEGRDIEEIGNEPVTIAESEAREKADTLLKNLGLTDYQCYEGGMFAEPIEAENRDKESDKTYYRNLYLFRYMRNMDGVFVNNTAAVKLVDEWRGDEYVKKVWGGEAVLVGVNDNGIVLFQYLTPLTIEDTVVEKTSIKTFEEIKDTFEKMVVVENAVEEGTVSIEVTDVRLVYTRISEKDSFDTGLFVPVWDFEGTVVDEYGYTNSGNILSINAIDGSVIDWTLGY